MSDCKLLNKFIRNCPFAVLTQAVIRGVMADEFDPLFEEHRTPNARSIGNAFIGTS